LKILLRFADADGLVRSLGNVGRGTEKRPQRSPSSAPVAGATRRNAVVGRLWALGGDRRPRLVGVSCFSRSVVARRPPWARRNATVPSQSVGPRGADRWREARRCAAPRNALYGHRRTLAPRRAALSSIVFDDFIGLAFHRGIGATRAAGEVCRFVGRTCGGHARSSRVRR